MTDQLENLLNQGQARHEALVEAMKWVVVEISGADRSRMTAELEAALGNEKSNELQAVLKSDPHVLEEASGMILLALWDEEDLRPVVAERLRNPDESLVITESATLALIALYGILWLVLTRGRKKMIKKLKKHPDGTVEVTETTEFSNFSTPIKTLLSYLSRSDNK
jgi:hypothetical protein